MWGRYELHTSPEAIALAGLTERWKQPDGELLETCTIVTTDANALLAPVHNRMPVIVPRDGFERWLDPAVEDPSDLVRPYPSDAIRYEPISTKVNAVRNDGPELIRPASESSN